jgi:hypothetical protein
MCDVAACSYSTKLECFSARDVGTCDQNWLPWTKVPALGGNQYQDCVKRYMAIDEATEATEATGATGAVAIGWSSFSSSLS